MTWAFDHFDSHYPWKQFNELTERNRPTALSADPSEGAGAFTVRSVATPPRSVSSLFLLLVKSNGDPVYERRTW